MRRGLGRWGCEINTQPGTTVQTAELWGFVAREKPGMILVFKAKAGLRDALGVNTTGNQIFGGGTFIKGSTGTTTFYAAKPFTVAARADNAATNRNFSHVSGITACQQSARRARAAGRRSAVWT